MNKLASASTVERIFNIMLIFQFFLTLSPSSNRGEGQDEVG